MKKFIFDVDGTLTPSRKQMHSGFSAEFLIFCCKFDTYLVTGSDRAKTIEQVGSDIYNRCRGYLIVLDQIYTMAEIVFIGQIGNHLMN